MQKYLETFAGQAGKLTAVGLAFFLVTALMMLFYIEESFNDIWRVHKGRPFVQRVTVYWAMVTLGPLLMGASLSLSTYLMSVSIAGNSLGENVSNLAFGISALPVLLEVIAFTLLYTIMPNVRVSIRSALTGAVIATMLFELSKKIFSLFVVNFSSYEIIYGALATIPILLDLDIRVLACCANRRGNSRGTGFPQVGASGSGLIPGNAFGSPLPG